MVLRRPLIILTIIAGAMLTVVIVQQTRTLEPVAPSLPTPEPSVPEASEADSASPLADFVSPTYEGPVYDPAVARAPTRDKPQSKLWFHDDLWWGSLFDDESDAFTIWWLDADRDVWVNTRTLVDDRAFARQDALWDGEVLVTISHGTNQGSARHAVQARQFTYDAESRSWTPMANFPVTVTPAGVEAASLARDGAGQLWAGFILEERVAVVAAGDGDLEWTAPISIDERTAVVEVDQAAIVAVGDDIGVIWSNQRIDGVFFALHQTGQPPDAWRTAEVALDGIDAADDHISVRSLNAPDGAWVYAAVKTSLDEAENRNQLSPQVLLLARSPEGTWSQHTFGRVEDRHTRPILVLDEERREAMVFATSPFDGGMVYMKRSPLDRIGFPVGLGMPVITGEGEPKINNATATHQSVGQASGLVVLAADDTIGRYLFTELGELPGVGDRAPVTSLQRRPVDLTFDGLAPGLDLATQGFRISPVGVGQLTIADVEGHWVARLASSNGEPARLCRPFPAIDSGTMSASALVRIEHAPAGDAPLMAIRALGQEISGLRALDIGRWAYRVGSDREVTGVTWAPGTWYRITIAADIAARRYSVEISEPDGEVLLTLGDQPWQADVAVVDEVCITAPRGVGSGVLLVDDLAVTFEEPS